MKLRVLLVALAVIVLASPAWACMFTHFTAEADCSGWCANWTILWGGDREMDVLYTITLSQGSTVIATVSGRYSQLFPQETQSVCGLWGMELCGDYTISGTVEFDSWNPQPQTSSGTFNCPCGGGGCHYTPGYWKNHAENWPLTTLTLGGVSYNQGQLLTILNLPTRKDATIIFSHHLIAAMLNVANGADASIQGAIDQANALLVTYPLGSNPPNPQRQTILNVKDILCDYNELVMPGCEEECTTPTFGAPKAAAAAPTESKSWGAIKGIYR